MHGGQCPPYASGRICSWDAGHPIVRRYTAPEPRTTPARRAGTVRHPQQLDRTMHGGQCPPYDSTRICSWDAGHTIVRRCAAPEPRTAPTRRAGTVRHPRLTVGPHDAWRTVSALRLNAYLQLGCRSSHCPQVRRTRATHRTHS